MSDRIPHSRPPRLAPEKVKRAVVSFHLTQAGRAELQRLADLSGVTLADACRYAVSLLPGWTEPEGGDDA